MIELSELDHRNSKIEHCCYTVFKLWNCQIGLKIKTHLYSAYKKQILNILTKINIGDWNNTLFKHKSKEKFRSYINTRQSGFQRFSYLGF